MWQTVKSIEGRPRDDNRSSWYETYAMELSSTRTVHCGGMEAKALSFVWHTAGSEHHQ